jgi:hypothetical protein
MTTMDFTRGADGRQPHWPPQYVDLLDGGTLHDWDDAVPAAEDEPPDEPMTYRERAWDICDEYGGIDDLLDRMWLHLGGQPDEPGPPAPARAGEVQCEDCGQRPGEIQSNFRGWVCWPCYEGYEDG